MYCDVAVFTIIFGRFDNLDVVYFYMIIIVSLVVLVVVEVVDQ